MTRVKYISVNIRKKILLYNRIYICIIKCLWYQSKYFKKEGRRILNFSQELQKDKSFQMLSQTIHLEEWGKYFEHKYIIKPSKNLIESWNTNEWPQCSLKRFISLSKESLLNSNQGLDSFRQTLTPKRQKFGQTSQWNFLMLGCILRK